LEPHFQHLPEIDRWFAPVVDNVIARAQLRQGQHVLDLDR
jgi:hypothetical protein